MNIEALSPLAQTIVRNYANEIEEQRKSALQDESILFDVDTCDVFGEHWETAIAVKADGIYRHYYPVERYYNEDDTVAGHLAWMERIKNGLTVEQMKEAADKCAKEAKREYGDSEVERKTV